MLLIALLPAEGAGDNARRRGPDHAEGSGIFRSQPQVTVPDTEVAHRGTWPLGQVWASERGTFCSLRKDTKGQAAGGPLGTTH